MRGSKYLKPYIVYTIEGEALFKTKTNKLKGLENESESENGVPDIGNSRDYT